ncbi:MAG: hypothetical protein ACR2QE_14995 [Acidimicrobiales bacterium]
MTTRGWLGTVLVAVGTVSLVLAILAGFVRDTFVDSSEFAARTEVAFTTDEVNAALTDQVVMQLLEAEPELLAVQPLLETVISGLLGSEVAGQIVRGGIEDLHRTVFTEDTDTVTVQLADLILVAKTQLTVLDPEVGAIIPDELTDAIIGVDVEPVVVDLVQTGEDIRLLAFLFLVVAVAAFVGAIWLAADPRRMLIVVGLAGMGAAAIVLVLELIVRAVVVSGSDTAAAVWDAFVVELPSWILLVASIGAVIAVVAWYGVSDIVPRARLARLRQQLGRRSSRRGRAVWGLVVAAAGVLLIAEWSRVVQFAVTVVGAAMVAVGVREILSAVAPFLTTGALEPATDRKRSSRGVRWLGSCVLVVVGVLAFVGLWRSGGETAAATTADGQDCNGSTALCDRPFDEVLMAATHNSNAAAADGFVLGYQSVGIVPQLESGIRGLLIDVYFGLDNGGDVTVTDRAPLTPSEREQLVLEVGEAAVASAEATVAANELSGGRRDLFLCHAFCEIGAKPFAEELRLVKSFLDDHPNEVITIIIQDEGPQPDDIAGAFEESGLIDLVYAHQPGQPWPTLTEMIEAGTRVFVSAENVSGQYPWYHDAFTLVQDTAFSYSTVAEFECGLNRGSSESPILLINHWLNPVSPTASDEANAAAVINDRLDRCTAERGQAVNLIAVDYALRGDVVAVVERRNDDPAG